MDMGCFHGKPSVSLQFCHMGCLCVGERDIADKPFKIIVMAPCCAWMNTVHAFKHILKCFIVHTCLCLLCTTILMFLFLNIWWISSFAPATNGCLMNIVCLDAEALSAITLGPSIIRNGTYWKVGPITIHHVYNLVSLLCTYFKSYWFVIWVSVFLYLGPISVLSCSLNFIIHFSTVEITVLNRYHRIFL